MATHYGSIVIGLARQKMLISLMVMTKRSKGLDYIGPYSSI